MRRALFPLLIPGMVLSMTQESPAQTPEPPVAKKIPHSRDVHGQKAEDPYYWLRQRDNPEVIAYLEAENAYTEAMTARTRPLQETLFAEIKSRLKETDADVPYKMGGFYYYTRTEAGKQYPIHCRKKGRLDAAEEVLLDLNALAAGTKYFRLGAFRLSPDHKRLAYSTDTNGSETYTVHIKDLASGALLPDRIANTYYGLEWGGNDSLFYTVLDAAKRPFKVFRHDLGQADDSLVHHEDDERFFVSLRKTRSGAYILIHLESQITSEVRAIDASKPAAAPRLIAARRQGIEYSVRHRGALFYILTNEDALDFKLVTAPVAEPEAANWKPLIPHREGVKIDSVDLFQNHMVRIERREGLERLVIRSFDSGQEKTVDFDEPVYAIGGSDNREFDARAFRFSYTSLVTPNTIYDIDMDSQAKEQKKRQEVPGYEAADYVCERLFARAKDGTSVPISLVYKKGCKRDDGQTPTLLYGYGSYGAIIDPRFRSSVVSLLDRGFVYAIGHIRGGGSMGRGWYENGKLLHKRNTFTDFVACAEALVAAKITSPKKLAIMGGSAGGLLMGATVNLRPDLFQAVVAHVPFVDVINTMLDPTIPLTVIEYEEWGNPNKPEFFETMLSYSPYDQVEAKAYPHILITAGLNDPRVQYWEPAKWTAKLRALKTDDNALLLKTNMGAGHGGASGRYDRLGEIAFDYAFIIDKLGVNAEPKSYGPH